MDKHDTDSITAFDTLYTTNQIQMLKVIFPYLQPTMQSRIAIYIKFHELLVSLRYSKERFSRSSIFPTKKDMDISNLVNELSPYISDNQKDMLQKFCEMQGMMENFQQISQLMQMMENEDSPDSVLQNFLSEEQMSMFKMFQEDFT